ncbi:hypothetical protein SAMN06265339_0578 [Desulfurobacterium pacificum]|uniref:Uncharacterized protein n=1 Tax=Desulfurobacterium pacificum TaxID=240166 RepID=A0ABY1NGE8_9BACT|nr:UPF0280 family protein [Desulfurobacterium pacificum]SMP08150.1 hypothetical protein SAMN06265339_0578 [Desulfurobacterium pacificum]
MLKKPKPEKRFYRKWEKRKGFKSFEIVSGESDIFISVPEKHYSEELKKTLLNRLITLREQILSFSNKHREFLTSLTPVKIPPLSPAIINYMAKSAKEIGVGPMAGVAGAINFYLSETLKERGIDEFFIENGGDTYFSSKSPVTVGIITGSPNIDGKIGIKLAPGTWSVCSSSSKIGHSLSLGRTQLVTVVAKDPAIADCAATFLANSKSVEEVQERFKKIKDKITGFLSFIDNKFAFYGLELTAVKTR